MNLGVKDLEDRVRRLLPTPLRVHIAGETGTGKNHLAYLFREDTRARGVPFVEVNVANLPDELFEAELFGARRGAFTGAQADRPGVLERANGGVLFLNEVGELSAAGQAKLLTVLDGGLYRRLGDPTDRRFDGRVISATNRDLAAEVRAGRFRADLYYRLAQVVVVIPSLRERPRDIVRLAREFLVREAARRGVPLRFERDALRALRRAPWPGNVRQLRDVVETLAWLAPPGGRIDRAMLDASLNGPAELVAGGIQAATPSGGAPHDGRGLPGDAGRTLRQSVADVEREELIRALLATGGNKTRAARRLGISVVGLRLKLRRLGMESD
jgi:DNA-binding NtrC family response regulator